MSKGLWFVEMERLMSEGASYESACDRAHRSFMDRLCDQADNMRKRMREDGASSAKPTPTPPASITRETTQTEADAGRTSASNERNQS